MTLTLDLKFKVTFCFFWFIMCKAEKKNPKLKYWDQIKSWQNVVIQSVLSYSVDSHTDKHTFTADMRMYTQTGHGHIYKVFLEVT